MSLPPVGGSSFNAPGIQKQNIAWLKAQTELMKAQEKYMEAVAKTKKEDWDAMTSSIGAFERFSASGGLQLIVGGSVERFKTQVSATMEGAFAPITNAATKFVSDLLDQEEPLGAAIAKLTNKLGDLLNGLGEVANKAIEFTDNIKFPGQTQTLFDVIVAGALGLITLIPAAITAFEDYAAAIEKARRAAALAAISRPDEFNADLFAPGTLLGGR